MEMPGYKINMLVPTVMKATVDRAVIDINRLRSGKEIDAIAVTGTSGSLIGYAISAVTGIPVIYVRAKEEQSSGQHHGCVVEGEVVARSGSVLFVDDFICSGQSLVHVHQTLKLFFGTSMLCGVYMYAPAWGWSPHAVPDEVVARLGDFPAPLTSSTKTITPPSHAYLMSVVHTKPAKLYCAMQSIVDLLITTQADGIAVCGKSGASIASLLQYYHGVRVVHVRKSCDTANHGYPVEGRPGLFRNNRVLFVDDLIATGGTAAWVFQQLKRRSLDMVGIALYRYASGHTTRQVAPTVLYTVAGGVVLSGILSDPPYSSSTEHKIATYEV